MIKHDIASTELLHELVGTAHNLRLSTLRMQVEILDIKKELSALYERMDNVIKRHNTARGLDYERVVKPEIKHFEQGTFKEQYVNYRMRLKQKYTSNAGV